MKYTIYKITSKKDNVLYVGMTVQPLQKRWEQHKHDARTGMCSVTSRMCKKKIPPDLAALHKYITTNRNGTDLTISKIKDTVGSYEAAHREELKVKRTTMTM